MGRRTRRPLRAALARALSPLLAAALLAALLATACGRSPANMAGDYTTTGSDDVHMALKATGKGVLSTPEDDISFTWERHGDQIWLHTKAGGVVVCALEDGGALSMDMPGVGRLRFTRR